MTESAMPDHLRELVVVVKPELRLRVTTEGLKSLAGADVGALQRAVDGVGAAMRPKAAPAPPVTPDLSARQLYLDAAPGGVDARYAWTVPGGRGAGVRIVDVEGGWNFTHESLAGNHAGVVAGVPVAIPDVVNHGTAVLGVFGGEGNGGVKG
ncbi:MAG: serine protease, partial [Betaproteobacteria bacterium]